MNFGIISLIDDHILNIDVPNCKWILKVFFTLSLPAQFLVFKYFQRIKCVIVVQVIPASEKMKENYCYDTKKKKKMLCAYLFLFQVRSFIL